MESNLAWLDAYLNGLVWPRLQTFAQSHTLSKGGLSYLQLLLFFRLWELENKNPKIQHGQLEMQKQARAK